MITANKIITFLRQKDYHFIKELPRGGLGKTILVYDDIIDEKFVVKKYEPSNNEITDEYFRNFVTEIKLLYLMNHKNIVRVFNYYLYPKEKTGYIFMEFIKGLNIAEYVNQNPNYLDSIFEQTIDGFAYLESNNILHRDIRPMNLLVNDSGILKVIDFGFGKKITFDKDFDKSISLNWWFNSLPSEFEEKVYDFKTEIYFVGKLFEELIQKNNLSEFNYKEILSSMTRYEYSERIETFKAVQRNILNKSFSKLDFSEEDKQVYRDFADSLMSVFVKIDEKCEYIADINVLTLSLEKVVENSILEITLQNTVSLARCFVNGSYTYKKNTTIFISDLDNFLKLFKSSSPEHQKIILNNLWNRLDIIPRVTNKADDDLPF